MRRRSFLAVAGWLATAAVATLIGVAAIRLVGESITGTPGGVLSQSEVERALASPPPATPGAGGSPSPGATGPATSPTGSVTSPSPTGSVPAGHRRAFATAGGSAVAECAPGGVRLVSWTPAPGYRVADVDRGPDDDVEVAFVGPDGELELKVRCVGGEPVAVEDDD
ncbi:septum formation initiator [Micromonospora endolithica]|uniref:Septum formation initiator n=1 Tax=Micromonospora endolithica TaxID=230091 RepID=A0A3A9ZHC5_9ACTN|nr:septum formation initiator [Micromonospora endolithica]RKN47748.1 septum formation initiator [Micromonospora endolithica]TWJ21423.1 serine/threonine-protein kinase [Micromonospora endolithica]